MITSWKGMSGGCATCVATSLAWGSCGSFEKRARTRDGIVERGAESEKVGVLGYKSPSLGEGVEEWKGNHTRRTVDGVAFATRSVVDASRRVKWIA